MAAANPLRDALTSGRFCYMVELVASASMAESKLWEMASSLAQIPEVVGAGITSYAGGSAGHDPIRVAEGLTHQLIDLKRQAEAVRCPTAFVRGTGSAEMTPEAAKDVAKFWSGTSVDIYSVEAKSNLQIENPNALAAAIAEFKAKRL